MTANELRQKYLDFFKSKGHTIISSASLIPENDPTVLFTTAGMHPLVPYLMGEKHPAGARLTDAQKCIRTDDIDEVGDATHHTFFEMMGNWSLGDYFKEDSIHYSWEFLTSPDWLGLDPNRLAVSVFVGDDDAPFDEESYNLWLSLGMPASRIAKLPKKNNWWGPAGTTGPCGPDTEIFYWSGRPEDVPGSFNDDNDLWVEIWNNVFMQYNKQADGTFIPLSQKNVDTGLGLERVTAVLNNCDNYQTDLFINIVNKVEELSNKKYSEGGEIMRAIRIVADHVKAAVFIIGDEKGVSPSNTGQGYIVRRLLRRAIRYGRGLGINQELWTKEVARVVINDYEKTYPELTRNQAFIEENFDKEEEKFNRTLENGLKEFNKINGDIDGVTAFNLYQSYGFPVEITEELAKEKNKKVDTLGFKVELAKHQELSRTASAGKFKGGLADSSEATTKLHTAAHLLLAALRKVLGDHVTQKGSNITADRLRFDFAHTEKMTPEQISEVEKLVNEAINAKMEVNCEEISLEEAKNTGAMGVFDSKYGEKVKVYTAGNFSREICGGPHVKNTGELGKFSIAKEESSSSGVRRIKAILS
jgi:alanyl-tRNA synthetase